MSAVAESIASLAGAPTAEHAWRPSAATRASAIAALALVGILAHVALRWGSSASAAAKELPLHVVLVAGGVPLVLSLTLKLARREFGSDLLAGIAIVAAVLLQEYLAGGLVVLMLSGGEALEALALGRASSVLQALARRMPLVAHRRLNRQVAEVPLADVRIGDELIVYPHEICPVDGVVVEGHGVMDESYLTGEPFMMPKARGSEVFSGAINGENALTLRPPAGGRFALLTDHERHAGLGAAAATTPAAR
jgi:cation transport ATPase